MDLAKLGNIATQLETLAGITPENGLRLEATEEAKLQRIRNAIEAGFPRVLGSLTDVNATNPATGEALVWNGTTWVPGVVGGGGAALQLDDLLDVEAPAPNSGDLIAYNATTGDWETSAPADPTVRMSKTLMIQYPQDGDICNVFFTNQAITISEVRAARVGGTDMEWGLWHGTTIHSTALTVLSVTDMSTGSGDDLTAFTDPTVPADSFITYEQGTTSGTPTNMSVTIFYTED